MQAVRLITINRSELLGPVVSLTCWPPRLLILFSPEATFARFLLFLLRIFGEVLYVLIVLAVIILLLSGGWQIVLKFLVA